MDGSSDELLQCVGRLEIASPKPVGFLCGTLPVVADATSFSLPHSALVPSPSQAMAAPRYQMLPTETDLNTLPLLPNIPEKVFSSSVKMCADLHWENGTVANNLSRKCEALAVSGLTEYGDEIDVVAPTDIMKQIFKIPYSKARLSIAVHRIGDTLILNTGPDVEEGEKMFRRQASQSKGSDPSIFLNFAMHSVRAEACDCPPGHYQASEGRGSTTILPGHFGHSEGDFVSSPSPHIGKTQFLDQSANDRHCGGYSKVTHDKLFWDAKNNHNTQINDSIKGNSLVGEKTRCPVQETDKCRKVGNNGFLRVLFWQFHNFRMLLGSDLLVFSNEKYVAVSLHLWDVGRQVTPLTWLEAWLDNVMASVPELAICYHQNGVVQGYELLKTDDIFLLKGISDDGTPAFHPQVVQQNGLSVLRFLQDNCKQDPGAYWLYKSAGEDVIQLFDLSDVPTNHSPTNHDTDCSSLSSLMHKGRRNSLFSLGTLLYRVAHRLSLSKSSDNKAKCAGFFKKCLDIMGEQDHLVVRAYAHEQFARFILKCREELDFSSESFLLESEATVSDVKDEYSVSSGRMLGSRAQDKDPLQTSGDWASSEVKLATQGSTLDTSGLLNMKANLSMLRNSDRLRKTDGLGVTETEDSMVSTPKRKSGLAVCQISSTPAHLVQTVTDPISSKLAAIHHVSQAIKSLRWKRQLQNTKGDLIDQGSNIHDRPPPLSFSVCACGDTDCIEVCDIREWLPKSRMDRKMWNLVLLLGESYLALGEAYRDNGQLDQTLKVVTLASSVYGSMPQQLEGSRFISTMVDSSFSCMKFEKRCREIDSTKDSLRDLNFNFNENYSSPKNSPSKYLFWAKAWMLVGDVYVEHHRIEGRGIPAKAESKRIDTELHLSEEVIREVKRLKKKLSQYQENCSTCSLINCSCRSDRASSGNSASSSGDITSVVFGGKQSRKSNMKNPKHSSFSNPEDDHSKSKLMKLDCSGSGNMHIIRDRDGHPHASVAVGVEEDDCTSEARCMGSGGEAGLEPDCNDVPEVKDGGIFKFLVGPKVGEVEHNLLAAIFCYDAARKAMDGIPVASAELQSVVKKKGWVFNELGRHRLNKGDLSGAELAFAEAIKAFKKISDHTNVILINCNLGHGRRALAEELVAKMEVLTNHGYAYKQPMKSAKMEYIRSLKYYVAAKAELNAMGEVADLLLSNEVYTQFAHTYLRFGMLLSKEDISTDICGNGLTEVTSVGYIQNTERVSLRKNEMSATDAFREALSMYESLGELRRQEAAFAYFQLACYHRDLTLKFLGIYLRQSRHSKCENSNDQKAKLHASLAERNWRKSLDFYGPKTHPVMYLNTLLEQSTLLSNLSSSFDSALMLESALRHLLEGRRVAEEESEDILCGQDDHIQEKFWNHLQALLKTMLLVASQNKFGSPGHAADGRNVAKLKEMYRMSLKSTHLCQLHGMYRLWISSS
uniref:Erythroid differentiation-related factor 1 n=2 Tax=Anthurium amnicola TaxID=1678845 RepID=A0A1D1YE88_9ARAE